MAIDELDERLLVRAYQAGDPRAFDTIVRTQWRALYAHAMRRLNDHESAEDAVQDTLLRAYRALPNLSGDLALRAWLHRILTNVCHDEGNRRRRRAGLEQRVAALPVEEAPDPIEEAVLHDTVRVMAEALQDLPDTYREALVLRYVDGLSFREVAEATGISEENARARVHRGRQALSRVLSRLSVMVAFLVPGLRRAQQTSPPAGPENAAADHVGLVTQLTSHAMSAAPTVTRVAAEMSALPSGKSALLTGAIAAAAAVSVPVAAYTVHTVTTPDKPAPAVAAPLEADDPADVETPGPIDLSALDDAGELPTSTTAIDGGEPTTTTVTSIAPSALHPFERNEASEDEAAGPATSPDSAPSTTTTVPPPATSEVVARLTSGELTVTGDRPNFDLAGTTTMTTDQSTAGDLVGRLSVYDDDTMSAELTIDVAGTQYALRIRGTITEVATEDGATTYHFTGRFSLPGGSDLGAPDSGDVVEGTLRIAGEGISSLQLDLSGTDG